MNMPVKPNALVATMLPASAEAEALAAEGRAARAVAMKAEAEAEAKRFAEAILTPAAVKREIERLASDTHTGTKARVNFLKLVVGAYNNRTLEHVPVTRKNKAAKESDHAAFAVNVWNEQRAALKSEGLNGLAIDVRDSKDSRVSELTQIIKATHGRKDYLPLALKVQTDMAREAELARQKDDKAPKFAVDTYSAVLRAARAQCADINTPISEAGIREALSPAIKAAPDDADVVEKMIEKLNATGATFGSNDSYFQNAIAALEPFLAKLKVEAVRRDGIAAFTKQGYSYDEAEAMYDNAPARKAEAEAVRDAARKAEANAAEAEAEANAAEAVAFDGDEAEANAAFERRKAARIEARARRKAAREAQAMADAIA